MKHETALKKTQ